jgi:hypothetical protein
MSILVEEVAIALKYQANTPKKKVNQKRQNKKFSKSIQILLVQIS